MESSQLWGWDWKGFFGERARLSNIRVRVRWFFAGTRGSWYCVDGWCRGDEVVGRVNAEVWFWVFWGAVGEGEGRFVFMFFSFGLEKDFGAHVCFRMVLDTTAGWDEKL